MRIKHNEIVYLKLDAPANINEVEWAASFHYPGLISTKKLGESNGVTPVAFNASFAEEVDIIFISIFNNDVISHDVELRLSYYGSDTIMGIWKLAPNKSIFYNNTRGFYPDDTGSGAETDPIFAAWQSANDNHINWDTAFSWGDHSLAGYFTLPTLTNGSIIFSNGTTLVQDNTNFFWNNTNKTLIIGGNTSAGTGNRLLIPVDPTITDNYGLISLGNAGFAGGTVPNYQGVSNGTFIAINALSTYLGDVFGYEVEGVGKFNIWYTGKITGADGFIFTGNSQLHDGNFDNIHSGISPNTSFSGIVLRNETPAIGSDCQYSPSSNQKGYGWMTDAGGSSKYVEFKNEVKPAVGTTAPIGRWVISSRTEGNSFAEILSLSDTGLLTLGGIVAAEAIIHVITPSASDIVSIFQAAAAQTANVTEWRENAGLVMSSIDKNGAWNPPSIADVNAVNNSVYYSTDAGKLVYKDSGGTPNQLY